MLREIFSSEQNGDRENRDVDVKKVLSEVTNENEDVVEYAENGNTQEIREILTRARNMANNSSEIPKISSNQLSRFLLNVGDRKYDVMEQDIEEIQEKIKEIRSKEIELSKKIAEVKNEEDVDNYRQEAMKRLEEHKEYLNNKLLVLTERVQEIYEETKNIYESAKELESGNVETKKELKKIRLLENKNIIKDIKIEEEDAKKFIEKSEEIIKNNSDPQEIAEELQKIQKELRGDFQATDNLIERMP